MILISTVFLQTPQHKLSTTVRNRASPRSMTRCALLWSDVRPEVVSFYFGLDMANMSAQLNTGPEQFVCAPIPSDLLDGGTIGARIQMLRST